MREYGGRPPGPEQERLLAQIGLPIGWRHPVTGRREVEPDPRLMLLGHYIRRSRYLVGLSQQALADRTSVPQSQISRLERALAPSMDVERLVWLAHALYPDFPLGFCPHDHGCAWIRTAFPSLRRDPEQVRLEDRLAIDARLRSLVPSQDAYDEGEGFGGDETAWLGLDDATLPDPGIGGENG